MRIGNDLSAQVNSQPVESPQNGLLQQVHGKHALLGLKRQGRSQCNGWNKAGQDEFCVEHGLQLVHGDAKRQARGNDGPHGTAVDTVWKLKGLPLSQGSQPSDMKTSTNTTSTKSN